MFERQDTLIFANNRHNTAGDGLGALFGWVVLLFGVLWLINAAVQYCINAVVSLGQAIDSWLQPLLSYLPF